MNYFKVSLLLFAFLLSKSINAQSKLGATVGFAGTTFNVETNQNYKDTASNFDKSYPKASMRLGLNLGLFYNLRITKLITVRPTLTIQFNQVGNLYLSKPEEISNIKLSVTSQRFTCPVLINFRKKGVVPYLNVAPAFQYALGLDDNARNNIGLNSFDILAQLGFGVKIPMKFFSITPEINFSQGLLDQKNNAGSNISNAIESLKTQALSMSFYVGAK